MLERRRPDPPCENIVRIFRVSDLARRPNLSAILGLVDGVPIKSLLMRSPLRRLIWKSLFDIRADKMIVKAVNFDEIRFIAMVDL